MLWESDADLCPCFEAQSHSSSTPSSHSSHESTIANDRLAWTGLEVHEWKFPAISMSALVRVQTGFRVEWCCDNANLPLAHLSTEHTGNGGHRNTEVVTG